ncbi:MAG TPA: SIMPL domain-containing protein [Thermoleophilia bacterium]|nr:SIMPL domain-containing protein [Thermoleophilia bacterium]
MQHYIGRKYGLPAWILAILLVAAVGVVAVGCADDAEPAVTGAGGSVQPIDSITVSGEGLVKAGPDEATLTIIVETDAPDAPQALDANSTQMTQVLERLKAEGLAEESLQTANVAVYPNRRWDPQSGEETIEGYRAQNSIRVTLTDLTKVGDVFTAATEAGANNISGPEWRLADDSAAVTEALDKAFASARSKAETLAKAAGLKLGAVLTMQESSVAIPPIMYGTRTGGDAASMESLKSTPVNPMDLEVQASVTLTFRLEK